jgi:hypothetical protein
MVLATTTLFGWLFLPSFVHFPNGYDLQVKRDPPSFARPVDNDNIVSLDVPGSALVGGAKVTLRFDAESRRMGSGSDIIRLRFDWPLPF